MVIVTYYELNNDNSDLVSVFSTDDNVHYINQLTTMAELRDVRVCLGTPKKIFKGPPKIWFLFYKISNLCLQIIIVFETRVPLKLSNYLCSYKPTDNLKNDLTLNI